MLNGAGGGIRTLGLIRDRILSPAPLTASATPADSPLLRLAIETDAC